MRALRYLPTLGRRLFSQTTGQTEDRTPKSVTADEYHVTSASPPTPPEESQQQVFASYTAEPVSNNEEGTASEPFRHSSTFDQLFLTCARGKYKPTNKITVVGAGDIGMATVFSLLTKGITNDISMVDFCEQRLKGELMDFQCGSKFLKNAKLRASTDFAISSDSTICVLTPCVESESGSKIGDCPQCNVEVLETVVPKLMKFCPDTILLVAIDPVDVMSYLVWCMSPLPKDRVFGAGTNLYSATFRYLLADRLGLAPSTCHGYIIGEHGETSVPVWSGVTVGGVHLKHLNPDVGTDQDPENWQEIHRQVLQSCQEIRTLKGSNSWATALSITDICSTILNDANSIRTLSTYVKGEHNIDEEIFMSLPCVVGASGITDIIREPLSSTEIELLQKSAEAIRENKNGVKIASHSD